MPYDNTSRQVDRHYVNGFVTRRDGKVIDLYARQRTPSRREKAQTDRRRAQRANQNPVQRFFLDRIGVNRTNRKLGARMLLLWAAFLLLLAAAFLNGLPLASVTSGLGDHFVLRFLVALILVGFAVFFCIHQALWRTNKALCIMVEAFLVIYLIWNLGHEAGAW